MREKVIKRVIEEIFGEKKIKVKKIILFGSRARGNYRQSSDWDILVITEEELQRKQKLEIAHLIRKKLADEFIPSDVLIKSAEEVEKRKGIIGSVIKIAISEGIVL